MAPELRVSIDLRPGLSIGPETGELLTAIITTGSISAAARACEMSFRKAWYIIDGLNASFVAPIVKTTKGGKEHGGSELTGTGREVLALYRAIVTNAQSSPSELQRLIALLA